MSLPPFRFLEAAYQLHFYLGFKTHYLRPLLRTAEQRALVSHVLDDVCTREKYHLLESSVTDDYLRLLVSLKPEQTVSRTVQLIKGNLSRQFNAAFQEELEQQNTRTLWAKGYFARSSGKVNLEAARKYVETQLSHHGYTGQWTAPLRFRNPAFKSPAFSLAHCLSVLDYHLVLSTQFRTPIFDEMIAPRLFRYVLAIGRKHGFAVESMSLVPDHMHLLLQAIPGLSIYECALAVLNNTRQWMETNFWGVLKGTKAWDVWQPSFYAGTVGEYSTAQVKKFLQDGR